MNRLINAIKEFETVLYQGVAIVYFKKLRGKSISFQFNSWQIRFSERFRHVNDYKSPRTAQ